MTYFFDNCVSPKLVRMLAALGVDAIALRDKFPVDVKDTEYLPQLRNTGWVLVTSDLRIRRTKTEAKALMQSGVTSLFLGPSFMKMRLWQQATWLVTHWPQIESSANQLSIGTAARIEYNGTLRIVPPSSSATV
jgi:hypothetical protein